MPKFLSTVDLDKNQIINIVVHRVANTAAVSAPATGQFIYDNSDGFIKYYNGTSWLILAASAGGSIVSISAGDGLSGGGSSGTVTLDVNVDNATLEISSDVVRIKDSGVTTNKLNDGAVTTIKLADAAVTFAKIQDVPTMTVIGRTASGTGVTSAIEILNENDFISNSNTKLATQSSIKAYVDSRIAGLGSLQGSFDASTATNLPGSGTTKKGDYWYVTVAGTVQTIVFNVGDVIIANQDNPTNTNPNHYIFVESNRDQATTTVLGVVSLATEAEAQAEYSVANNTKAITPKTLASRTATETRTGIAEIATQIEVNTGTDDTRFVTPLKLKTFFDANTGGYSTTIGNGSAASFVLTHNLGTRDVIVDVSENASPYNKVETDVAKTSTTTVTISFTTPPTSNQYRVTIRK